MKTISAWPRDDRVIARAIAILERRLRLREPETRYQLGDPDAVHLYVRLKLAELEREVFACIFVDAQHRPIAFEELFRGTLTQVVVHPREIARAALRHNAAAVILVHNHPSSNARFSDGDRAITAKIRHALELIDVKVLDHLLVARAHAVSYAREEAMTARADGERRARQAAAMKASWQRRRLGRGK